MTMSDAKGLIAAGSNSCECMGGVGDQTGKLVGMILWQVVTNPIILSDLQITWPGVEICGSQAALIGMQFLIHPPDFRAVCGNLTLPS